MYSLTGAATLASLPACKGKQPGNVKKPMNILYIMCDDHSYQTISAYDQRFIETPNIDRIANEGVRFTNSFVANSLSGPSRACLLTGKHSHKNGFTDNTKKFDGNQQTFPKLLQQAGYQTAIVGKWHLTSEPTGFDYWNILIGQGIYYNPYFIDNGEKKQIEGYATNITTDLALDWLDNKRDKKNHSVYYSTTRLHTVLGCRIPAIWIYMKMLFIQYLKLSMINMKDVSPHLSKK